MTNESSATSKQFNQLIAALGTDLELTGEEIADIIWFSQKREEVSNTPNDTTSQAKNQSNASVTTYHVANWLAGTEQKHFMKM